MVYRCIVESRDCYLYLPFNNDGAPHYSQTYDYSNIVIPYYYANCSNEPFARIQLPHHPCRLCDAHRCIRLNVRLLEKQTQSQVHPNDMPDSIIHQPERIHRNEIITLENQQLEGIDQKYVYKNIAYHPGGIGQRRTQDRLENRFQ